MNIRHTTLAVAIILALSFLSVNSYKLYSLYHTQQDSVDTQTSIEAASIFNKAIIELSLERSVMQVTLNLDDPIAPEFKDLLNGQRQKSDSGFQEVIALVSKNESFRRGSSFLTELKTLQQNINDIRRKADINLQRQINQRNENDVKNLPPEMKDTILALSKLPLKLRPENAQTPTSVNTLQKIQHNAWAIREFGGRERTYFAIATATGRQFDAATKKEMKQYHSKAVEAMSELSLLAEYSGLSKEVTANIKEIEAVYFGTYEQTRNDLLKASETNTPYPVSFGEFFTESSEALGTAVDLSYLAGDEMVLRMNEVHTHNTILFWVFGGVLGFAIVLCGFQIYYTQVKVSDRILKLAGYMKGLTNGNTDVDLTSMKSSDEIGQMVEHVEVFKTNAIEVKRLERDKIEQEKQVEKSKKQAAQDMADSFEKRVGMIVEGFEKAALELQTMSNAIADATSQASTQSLSVANASQEATSSVQTVAAAAEEMSASINEISYNVMDTAEKAKQCASSAQISQDNLAQLQKAVGDIDSVIQSINDVAEQTNLLALNATIEAARAGEAGKGFAVVASEVKSLANETHKMTDEISNKVRDIKESAQYTIESVNNIITQIADVDNKTASVAGAIEQQSGTTSEISQSATHAATGTDAVSKNIADVQKVTEESAASTNRLKTAASDLLTQAGDLKMAINGFLQDIRTA